MTLHPLIRKVQAKMDAQFSHGLEMRRSISEGELCESNQLFLIGFNRFSSPI
jgi:hypothetical protein